MEQSTKRQIVDKHLAKRAKQARRIAYAQRYLKTKNGNA